MLRPAMHPGTANACVRAPRPSMSASLPWRAPRVDGRAAVRAKAQKKEAAGPAPPPQNDAAPDSAVEVEDATEAVQDEEVSSDEELATAQRLLLAIRTNDTSNMEVLGEAVVTETEALAAAVEAAEADKRAVAATLDTLKDQYRRLQADFDNFRSRADKDKAGTAGNVKQSIVKDLLPLIDNFEIASTADELERHIQVKAETEGEQKIHGSYQGLYKQMVDIFRGMGVEAVETKGAPFDPELHDGVMREENDEVPDGTVLEEFRKGFLCDGKLLRPAMVKVSYSQAASDSAATDSESSSSE